MASHRIETYCQSLAFPIGALIFSKGIDRLVRSGRLKVVESFDVDAPKTQQLNAKIEAIGGGKTLIVTESGSQNLFLAAQNLPYVGVVDVAGINPVDLVYADNVVMTVDTVKKVEEWLA